MTGGSMPGRPLILGGTPHAGVSVLATALLEAGMFLGDVNGLRSDGLGYLEDHDLRRFQDGLLAHNGTNRARMSGRERLIPANGRTAGGELVRAKFEGRPAWGWKDPATLLFLDYWQGVLGDPRWIFVCRRPELVVWAQLVNSELDERAKHPPGRARAGLLLWHRLNARIADFATRHRERSLILIVPDHLGRQGADMVNRVLVDGWGYELDAVDLPRAYVPQLLKQRAPKWVSGMAELFWPAGRLFGRLERLGAELRAPYLGARPRRRA